MLDPVTLERPRPGRRPPSGDHPRGREIALLAQVSPQDPRVEVPGLDPLQPLVEHPERRVNGDRLMVVGRGARADRSRVGAVLPEERPHPRPIAAGEAPCVTAEKLVDGVFVPPGARGSAIFDPASEAREEAETECRKTQTAQADRPCVSTWARSSRLTSRLKSLSRSTEICSLALNSRSVGIESTLIGRASVLASRNRP